MNKKKEAMGLVFFKLGQLQGRLILLKEKAHVSLQSELSEAITLGEELLNDLLEATNPPDPVQSVKKESPNPLGQAIGQQTTHWMCEACGEVANSRHECGGGVGPW